MSITDLSAADLSMAVHDRRVTCREVMAEYLDRIDAENPSINAIVSIRDRKALMVEAKVCDDEIAAGRSRGWMHGMPQAIKDLSDTKGLATTSGSRLFADFVPDFDCVMVERMKAAGCIVIGKTNVPEFGLGSHTYNDVFGITRNAFDHTRTAGGSSGGAAVAVAMRMLPVADGSDYMGSLRNPAAWNNVFGFRPSQGRLPSWPTRDTYLAQLATQGPIGRTVLDVALLLGTQAGEHRSAPLSIPGRLGEFATVAAAQETLAHNPTGTRVGWLGDLDGHLAFEPGIIDRCASGLSALTDVGCVVEPAMFDMSPDQVWGAWLVWRHVLIGNGLRSLIGDPANREFVKPEALWEVDQSATISATQLVKASEVRTAFYMSITALFERFDVLAIPTTQVWPFDVEQTWPRRIGERAMDTYHRWMEVTIYSTFAGLPAISVPVGFDERGLPMGMQLIGRPRGDVELLKLAAAYEPTIEQRRPLDSR